MDDEENPVAGPSSQVVKIVPASKLISSSSQISEATSPKDAPNQTSPTKNPLVLDDKTIIVNSKQKGNPLIANLKGLQVVYEDNIEADYIVGKGAAIVFLSLKYHNLYPNYIYDKIKLVGTGYPMQILLVLIDITDPRVPLKELTKFAMYSDSTLMLCWSFEEAAKYVEYYKNYRNKPPSMLMEKQLANDKGTEGCYECVAEALASVKKVNKTDAISLISTFESFEKLAKSPSENIALCHGVGPQKAEHLYNLFRRPFVRKV